MKVYIDSREQDMIQRMLVYWKKNREQFKHIEDVSVRTNAAGDTCTDDGFVGIERKKEDFIPSILGGKLKQQLYELKQNFTHAILFVEGYEGIMDCITKNPRVHPNVILGTVKSSFAHSHVPIMFVGQFYIPLVFGMIEKFYDGREMTAETYNPIRRGMTKEEEQLNIVIGIGNIGMTDGKKLLQHFDYSIKSIANAPVEDIMKIKGFGKTKSEHIKEILE